MLNHTKEIDFDYEYDDDEVYQPDIINQFKICPKNKFYTLSMLYDHEKLLELRKQQRDNKKRLEHEKKLGIRKRKMLDKEKIQEIPTYTPKHIFETGKQLNDFDAVSLYPTAIVEMGGFLKGKPRNLTKEELESLKFLNYDDYFVQIKIKKVHKWLHFPYMSKKAWEIDDIRENGRMWTNEMVGEKKYCG